MERQEQKVKSWKTCVFSFLKPQEYVNSYVRRWLPTVTEETDLRLDFDDELTSWNSWMRQVHLLVHLQGDQASLPPKKSRSLDQNPDDATPQQFYFCLGIRFVSCSSTKDSSLARLRKGEEKFITGSAPPLPAAIAHLHPPKSEVWVFFADSSCLITTMFRENESHWSLLYLSFQT